MLVLRRRTGESIETSNGITFSVLEIRGNMVNIGIMAPKDVTVRRAKSTQQRPALNVKKPTEH